jgi:hypothetical protein
MNLSMTVIKSTLSKHKMSMVCMLSLILGLLHFSCISTKEKQDISESTPLTKKWMEDYLKQPIPESARKNRYFNIIEKNKGDYCNLDVDFFTNPTDTVSSSRSKTNALGSLAFCYHTPGLKYYKDSVALEMLIDAFRGMVKHITDTGMFDWKLDELAYRHGSHEHAWRLEPLLLGYIWVKDELSEPNRIVIETALKRAGEWLYKNPTVQHNNRGIVSSSVLAMYGIYFEEPAWFELAKKIGDDVFPSVVLENGQIGEHTEQYAGGGPDIGYTYTSLGYLYTYQLWTGGRHLEPLIKKAAHWLTGYNTLSQWPVVVGASVRTTSVNAGGFRDCLPLFEKLSKSDPYYAYIAEKALQKVEGPAPDAFQPGGKSTHIVSPAIWALLEGGTQYDSSITYKNHVNRFDIYNNPNVDYALIAKDNYQTGIVFKARSGYKNNSTQLYRNLPAEGLPLRGMQTWAWREEKPVILHDKGGANGRHSFTAVGGYNTATTNASAWKKITSQYDGVEMLMVHNDLLWTLYIFTHYSTVVVYGGVDDMYHTQLFINPDFLPQHAINTNKKVITFENMQGQIHWLKGKIKDHSDRVEFWSKTQPAAFGFSNDEFRFMPVGNDPWYIAFTDASGRFNINLKQILGIP